MPVFKKSINTLTRNLTQYVRMRCLLFVLCILISQTVFSADIIKKITYAKKGKFVEVVAHLDFTFNYVKHFPRNRGKIIQIQIKERSTSATGKRLKRREIYLPDDSVPLPIRDVIFEGNVRGGPYLVFRFNQIVEFSVKSVSSGTEISILVKVDEVSDKIPSINNVDDSGLTIDQLMDKGRTALTSGKNSQAILVFSKLLNMTGHKYMSNATEYLGLARERNGQLALAKKEYEKYLKLYPKERHAKIIKQRLMVLSARLSTPKKKLRLGKKQAALLNAKNKKVDLFGRVSQYYYRGVFDAEANAPRTQQNSLMSFFDITRRARSGKKETRMVFSASHEIDFLDGRKMETRVRSAYGEYQGKRNGFEITLGRQSVNNGGVLGRFDGGLIGIKLMRKVKSFLVAGWPVGYINHQEIQTDKPMLGGRLVLDGVIPRSKVSAYAIRQNVNRVVNRAAVGGDFNYFYKNKVFYSLIDYDVPYNVINFLTTHIGWQVTKKVKLDFHFDRRRSPVMLTTNALQGLSVQRVANEIFDSNGLVVGTTEKNELNFDSFEALGSNLPIGTTLTIKKLLDLGIPMSEIKKRALQNTGRSTLITFSTRILLKSNLTLNSYLSLNKYESGLFSPLKATEFPNSRSFLPSNFNYSFSSQLIKSNFLETRGILIGGGRVTSNENNRRVETNFTIRSSIANKWWADYRMRFAYTVNRKEGKRSARVSPKFKLDYRPTRKLTLEVGVGVDYNKTQFVGQDYTLFILNSGFRYLF